MTQMLSEVSIAVKRSSVISVKALPFVKWAGGKRSLVPTILKLRPYTFNTYWEPFLGGGAVFFALEHESLITRAKLSDINMQLILTYQMIKENPDLVIDLLHIHADNNLRRGKEYYYEVRQAEEQPSAEELAARFIYLNKTCFNGLYRVNRKGEFNVPYGKYDNPKICDEKNLRAVSLALLNADFKFDDFTNIQPGRGDFVYCDPPYDGTYANYDTEGFDSDDQIRLRECVDRWRRAGANVMLSNSNTSFIRELYADFNRHEVTGSRSLNSNGNGRGPVTELIITTY